MPRLNGLDAAQQLKQMMPEVKLIFLTVNEDPNLAAEAFRVGASAYLLKSCAASELFQAIQQARQGRSYVTPLIAEGLVESLQAPTRRQASSQLTPRQREVLQLLVEGHSMKEVGALLFVAPRTVAFHKYRIMDKLGLTSNAELLQFAINNNILSA